MNFEMVGKLSIGKETDKFKPWDERKYDSGWISRKLMFNAICGDNRHMLTVSAGSFEDGHGDVYTYSKGYTDDNGNKVKGESLVIPFKDRLTSPKIAEVAEFRKFVFDTEVHGRRRALELAVEHMKDGKPLTDEELKLCGVESESEVKVALEKSNKKHKEFISPWDFVEHIKKVIDSGKYTDKKFYIRGALESQYSDQNERFYDNLIPQRIYLADDDAEEYSTATIDLLYGSESVDKMSVDEKGKVYINGWMMERDNNRKENLPHPATIVIPVYEGDDPKEKTKVDRLVARFNCEEEKIKECGVVVNMLNGAQRQELRLEDLDEELQMDIECGLVSIEDIKKEMGMAYGPRVQEWQFKEFARGFAKGVQETAFTPDDMVVKPVYNGLDEDLFDDSDDDDDI